MPKVRAIEKRIWDIEGFEVQITQEDGRDIRSGKVLAKQYEADRAAKNSFTASAWVEKRFKKQFPGLDANILDGNGEKVRGNTTLGSIRDTYD